MHLFVFFIFYMSDFVIFYCHRLGVSLRDTLCLNERVSVMSKIY